MNEINNECNVSKHSLLTNEWKSILEKEYNWIMNAMFPKYGFNWINTIE